MFVKPTDSASARFGSVHLTAFWHYNPKLALKKAECFVFLQDHFTPNYRSDGIYLNEDLIGTSENVKTLSEKLGEEDFKYVIKNMRPKLKELLEHSDEVFKFKDKKRYKFEGYEILTQKELFNLIKPKFLHVIKCGTMGLGEADRRDPLDQDDRRTAFSLRHERRSMRKWYKDCIKNIIDHQNKKESDAQNG